MNDYIINSFIFQKNNTLFDILNYVKTHYNNSIKIKDVNTVIKTLKNNNVILIQNKIYTLSEKGNVILNDHIYYYSIIIVRFLKRHNKNLKKYVIREIRLEQQFLRNCLIKNKQQVCVLCDKKLPLCLLETAHLKPRCLLRVNERTNVNVVEFMCRYCHNLYDNGFLGVYNGELHVSSFIKNYDIYYPENKQVYCYNSQNELFFSFHYKYIYKVGIVL